MTRTAAEYAALVPDQLASRLAAASDAEREAAAAHDKAQRALRRELRAAQRKGYSVRALAAVTRRSASMTYALLTHHTNGGKA